MSEKPAKLIGKYQIIGKVAQGGMGALYKARHPTLDRYVLLKKLALRGGTQFVERFKREAHLMMDLKHDHIVQVYDHFKEGSSYYIVEEFVDGISLDALIRKERYLSNDATLLILYEVCRALKHAHDHGVIHRDIKPANILISHSGDVKLVDFGIATSVDDAEDGLTQAGMTLGTPSYIAPEQIGDAKNVDKRADIYSLGVVLYEMLTGKIPFAGNFTAETIAAIHKGRYVPPQALNPTIAPVLRKIARKAMKTRPGRRYQDLDRVISILERRVRRRDPASIREAMKSVLTGGDIGEIFRRRLPWLPAAGAAAAALCLLAGGAYYLYCIGYHLELFAADRYGALVASVRVEPTTKDPGDLYIAPVLYRDDGSALSRVEDVDLSLRERASLRTESGFVFESRKLYLPPGEYRLKVNVEGQLHWQSFTLDARVAQREDPATADAEHVSVALERGAPLPLEVRYRVLDANTGEDLTYGTPLSVFRDSEWVPWDFEVASSLTSGGSYRFMLEREDYYSQVYNLIVEPYQSLLHLEARLVPCSGTLVIVSNAAELPIALDGSRRYLTGGKERTLRRLEPLEQGTTRISLDPGTYLLTVGKDSSASSSMSVRVLPNRSVTVRVDYRQADNAIVITPAE